MVRIIRAESQEFEVFFSQLRERGQVFDAELTGMVAGVIDDVRRRGDEALFAYTARWDKHPVNAATIEVSREEWREAAGHVDAETTALIRLAASRIEKFHERQRQESWSASDEDGVELGQMVIPLKRVGIYAPGGLASYPSTVLMTAIPARIAGVREIILATPCPGGALAPLIAAAAEIAGVSRIFRIGGAQAVAALAYGTESIPRVDKIVGPGNKYVAAAKKMVFGQVAIDMIAGPSEVLVIADRTGNAAWAAADMLAQAEHDENAGAVLMTPDEAFAEAVAGEVKRQLDNLERYSIAARSLQNYGAVIITHDLDEAIGLANQFAPEHLELMVENPQAYLPRILNAGAVFMGRNTPEALGDYMAGPNHVLPTGGTARFASPLGVYDFYKRTSVLSFSGEALTRYAEPTARFADLEGLFGHARSVRLRLKP
jgi:histidinol dehydrogenase